MRRSNRLSRIHVNQKAHPRHKDADYRMVVKEVMSAMTTLAHTLDYSNFKSEIAKTEDQCYKLSAYHKNWELMIGFKKKFGKAQT